MIVDDPHKMNLDASRMRGWSKRDEIGRYQNAFTFPTDHLILENVHWTRGSSIAKVRPKMTVDFLFDRPLHPGTVCFQKSRPRSKDRRLAGPSTSSRTFYFQRIVYYPDRPLPSRLPKMNSLLFHFKWLISIFPNCVSFENHE